MIKTLRPGLKELLNIDFPVIMAPMFLVSNTSMIVAATHAGITGAIPAHNFRTIEELITGLQELKEKATGPFGVNLIVNKSNLLYKKQLEAVCASSAAFIITSLGSPRATIEAAHKAGIKVFCDVTDLEYAKKVEKMGADALIAVNKDAGGHAGSIPREMLVSILKKHTSLPVISAGGISTGGGIRRMLSIGADGLSMGTIFIASEESPVSHEYKEACVKYGAKDIVMTNKLSGTPCTVIKTPYIEQIGTQQNFIERLLNKNRSIKKWMKALTFYKGMKILNKAAFSATYKTVWCAGPSIEHVYAIKSVSGIVDKLKDEYENAAE